MYGKGNDMDRSERLKKYWEEVRAGERPAPKRTANGPLKRKVRCNHHWLKGSEIIVTVYPHGELGFREPKRRAEYKISIADAFRSAVVLTTNKIASRVKALRKEGYGLAKARRMAAKEVL